VDDTRIQGDRENWISFCRTRDVVGQKGQLAHLQKLECSMIGSCKHGRYFFGCVDCSAPFAGQCVICGTQDDCMWFNGDCRCIDCHAKSIPAPRLVGVETNPGPADDDLETMMAGISLTKTNYYSMVYKGPTVDEHYASLYPQYYTQLITNMQPGGEYLAVPQGIVPLSELYLHPSVRYGVYRERLFNMNHDTECLVVFPYSKYDNAHMAKFKIMVVPPAPRLVDVEMNPGPDMGLNPIEVAESFGYLVTDCNWPVEKAAVLVRMNDCIPMIWTYKNQKGLEVANANGVIYWSNRKSNAYKRRARKKLLGSTPPAPRLVNIEPNPGPEVVIYIVIQEHIIKITEPTAYPFHMVIKFNKYRITPVIPGFRLPWIKQRVYYQEKGEKIFIPMDDVIVHNRTYFISEPMPKVQVKMEPPAPRLVGIEENPGPVVRRAKKDVKVDPIKPGSTASINVSVPFNTKIAPYRITSGCGNSINGVALEDVVRIQINNGLYVALQVDEKIVSLQFVGFGSTIGNVATVYAYASVGCQHVQIYAKDLASVRFNDFTTKVIEGRFIQFIPPAARLVGIEENPGPVMTRGFIRNCNSVLRCLRVEYDPDGVWIPYIIGRTGLTPNETHAAIDYLNDEGWIYSTIDNIHFSATNIPGARLVGIEPNPGPLSEEQEIVLKQAKRGESFYLGGKGKSI
jgi:hypothetical protein